MDFVDLLQNISLSQFTTLGLGGNASYLAICKSEDDVVSALKFAKEKQIPIWVMGGGSNTIVSDAGFEGLVIKIEILGIEQSTTNDVTKIQWKVGAGIVWDDFVKQTIEEACVGIESLSGIPGTIGASPIQNIGAYGQEVSETIKGVRVINSNLEILNINSEDCKFKYRDSRFKSGDWKNLIITQVTFELSTSNPLNLKYPEVRRHWDSKKQLFGDFSKFDRRERISTIVEYRELILRLRKSKSMVLDPLDPNSKSVGSFFTNPVLSSDEFVQFQNNLKSLGLDLPNVFPEASGGYKVSAAWLIEQSGFQKGYTKHGVGISSAHCLSLININGKTKDLLNLSEEIKQGVFKKFKINLIQEPVYLQ